MSSFGWVRKGLRMSLRRVRDALELRDALLGVRAPRRLDEVLVELRAQLGQQPLRFLLRLEAGAVDGAVAGLAAVDARHRHVVHVDEEIVQHDLVDLQRRVDEVEHRRVEDQEFADREGDVRELLLQQLDVRGQLFPAVLDLLDARRGTLSTRARAASRSRVTCCRRRLRRLTRAVSSSYSRCFCCSSVTMLDDARLRPRSASRREGPWRSGSPGRPRSASLPTPRDLSAPRRSDCAAARSRPAPRASPCRAPRAACASRRRSARCSSCSMRSCWMRLNSSWNHFHPRT